MVDNIKTISDAEQALLYSIIKDKNALTNAIIRLRPEDFTAQNHTVIFKAILDLWHDGQSIDEVSIKSRLSSQSAIKVLEEEIKWNVANPEHHSTYIDIIKNFARCQDLTRIGNIITKEASKTGANSNEVLSKAEQMIIDLAIKGESRSFYEPRSVIKNLKERILKRTQDGNHITGVSTFIDQLDQLTLGLQPKELTIIAGRPSSGKSSIAMHLAIHNAVFNNLPVAFFSLEMSAEALMERAIANLMEIDSWKLRAGRLSQSEQEQLEVVEQEIIKAPIYIDETSLLSIIELQTKAKRLKMQVPNLSLIIVDYLQLMMGSRDGTREREISSISSGLKQLAKELEIPVIGISQLSREVERREGNRPRLSDLRESGGLEQDADLVIFLYREYLYSGNEDDKTDCEIIIGKHRNGAIGDLKVLYLPDKQRFYSLKE